MNSIMEKLFHLSKRGGVTDRDIAFLRADKQIDENVYVKKASVGAVEEDIFILFNSERNKLKVQDDFWLGKEKSEPEILFYKNSKLVSPVNEAEAKRFGVIVFSKESVWVIQPTTRCAGRYSRE
ncbi:hypothetical protein [Variovorax paradoxus]|nr:hypothetical protein [Variovorax paradoxus]